MAATRLICTGSRDLDDEAGRLLVDRVLDDLYREHGALHILVGDCKTGGDEYVRNWVRYRKAAGWDVDYEEFAAHWHLFTPRSKAGPARNQRMVEAGASLAVAFFQPGAGNKGTSSCVELARAAGIPVKVYGREAAESEQETLPI